MSTERSGRRAIVALAGAIVGFALLTPIESRAQSASDIANDLTTVIDRFEPPLRRPPTFGLTVSEDIAGVAVEAQSDVRFRLVAVEIVGADTLSPALLQPLWSGLLGRTITLADLRPVLEGIEEIYRKNDYYALALVPPQDLSDGRIRIVVYESYIRDLVIESTVPNLRARLQPYIDRIVAMRPVRISRLERYLLLMADLGGMTLDAKISKIVEEPGAGLLVLKFTFTRRTLQSRIDNFGTEDTGPIQLSGIARFNDVFGSFETTEALAVTNPLDPEEVVFARLSQVFPLGPSGLFAGYELGHVWANPGGEDDVHAETTIADIYLDYAFLRSQERNLFGTLALYSKDVAVDVDGNAVLRSSNRWITATATYDDTIAGVAVLTEATLAQGIDGLGSNGDDADFRYASLDAQLSRDLSDSVTATFLFTGQKALTALPPAVRFDLGGENFGRAFENGTITGDDGAAAAFEISRSFSPTIPWLTAFSLFGFVDYGAVWNDHAGADYEFASLGSVGVGFRSIIGKHASLTAYVATPYKTEPGVGKGAKFRFAFGARY